MSVINQMLRELDARAMPGDTPTRHLAAKARPRLPVPVAAGIGLLAVAAIVYGLLSGLPVKHATPVVAATVQPKTAAEPVGGAADVAPTLHHMPPGAVVAMPAPAADAPERPVAKRVPQLAAATPISGIALSPETSMPRAEPAVVKQMTGLSPEAEAQQYFDEAQALRHAAKPDAAAAKYRQALERNPGMVQARIQLARLLQERGQADAGLLLLSTGYAQRPDDTLAIAAGRMLADSGQRDEALVWLARGQDGLRPSDHALMGTLLSQAQRHEEAIRAYRRALATDADHGGWLLGLGLALEAQGQIEEARTVFRRALERGQFKPEVVLFLRERSGMSAP